jgi:hypothetical protein
MLLQPLEQDCQAVCTGTYGSRCATAEPSVLLLLLAGRSGDGSQVLDDASLARQLQRLKPLLQPQAEQQPQQQQLQTPTGSIAGASESAGPGTLQYPQSGYSCSVQSFDDLGATDSAASSPRSRSSYAASSQHQPPSR